MTVIGANPYATGYVRTGTTGTGTATTARATTTQDGGQADTSQDMGPAVKVNLSAEAKAALKAQTDSRTSEAVVTDARAALNALLKTAGASSALKDGRATIDVSNLDRRSLFAIASDRGKSFSLEEQVVATLELKAQRDEALAGPAAQTRATGDYSGLYKAALDQLDAAGPEEKATGQWAKDRAAVAEGFKQAQGRPGVAPTGVQDDPVAAYLKDAGGAVFNSRNRDFSKVAADVRTALDRQYSLAVNPGAATGPDDGQIDFSRFDARSLAAVSLNRDALFSEHEVRQAAAEIRIRDRAAVKAGFDASGASDDPAAFGKAMISRYADMSTEEREAAGWTPQLYEKMIALQDMRSKLSEVFGASGTTATATLLNYLS